MTKAKREAGYEKSDVSPRLLALLAGGLALAVLVVLTAVAVAFPQSLRPTAASPSVPPGGAPRLQSDPYRDRTAYAGTQRHALNAYGRTADGRVRIPVDRAMRKVASRGWGEAQ